MSPPPDPTKPLNIKEYETFNNRINVALARHKRVVQGWVENMYKKAGKSMPPEKSEEELDKEDAEFLNFWEPPHLGLGAKIPKEYYNEKGELIRKEMTSMEKLATIPELRPAVLRIQEKEKLLSGKMRTTKDKTTTPKRAHKSDSSDEEEGRSALGKAKKSRTVVTPIATTKPKSSTNTSNVLNALDTQSFVTSITAEEDLEAVDTSESGFLDERKSSVTVFSGVDLAEPSHFEESDIKKTGKAPTLGIVSKSLEVDPTNVSTNSQADQDAEAKREKNRLKKARKRERKRLEKEKQRVA